MVERPTGGGIAFHGSDLSISVTMPRAERTALHALMDAIGRSTVALCRSYGADAALQSRASGTTRIVCCLTESSPYAVMVDQRKVGGFALRRFPHSWLIQGSLLLRSLPERLTQILPSELVHLLRDRAVALSEAATETVEESLVSHRWAASWSTWWRETTGTGAAGLTLQAHAARRTSFLQLES